MEIFFCHLSERRKQPLPPKGSLSKGDIISTPSKPEEEREAFQHERTFQWEKREPPPVETTSIREPFEPELTPKVLFRTKIPSQKREEHSQPFHGVKSCDFSSPLPRKAEKTTNHIAFTGEYLTPSPWIPLGFPSLP